MTSNATYRHLVTWLISIVVFGTVVGWLDHWVNSYYENQTSAEERSGSDLVWFAGLGLLAALIAFYVANFFFIVRSRQVVISYAREDKLYAMKLQWFLRAHGVRVWRDSSLRYGDEWPKEIESRISRSASLVVVMSENSHESRWVKREIRLAEDHRTPIQAILIEGDPHKRVARGHHYYDAHGRNMPNYRWRRALWRFTG